MTGSFFAAVRVDTTYNTFRTTSGALRLRTRVRIASKNISSISFTSNKFIINYAETLGTSDDERFKYAHTGMARDSRQQAVDSTDQVTTTTEPAGGGSGVNILGPQGQGDNDDDTRASASYAFFGSLDSVQDRYRVLTPIRMDKISIVVHYINDSSIINSNRTTGVTQNFNNITD